MARWSALPRLDRVNQCLWRDERRIELSANAFRLLVHLVERPQMLVTKDELLDAVWPDAHVVDAVLSVAVSQLRDAFDDEPRQPRFIETVHGRGYRWIGTLASDDAPGGAGMVQPDERSAAPIFGREGALAQLAAAAAHAAAGRRQLVFVTGEPGIGKTALIDHFLASAALRPCRIARGQCIDAYGTAEPYMPLLEALQQLLRDAPDAIDVLRTHAPTWLLQLPGAISRGEHDELQRALASSTGGRMVRELQQALESLAGDRTVILVLEDLHWSDAATVAALAGFALRREAAKLLVIGSYRPVDAIAALHPIIRLARELAAKRHCVEIALDGLAIEPVAEVLAARFAAHAFPPELAQRLHAQTGGNPLFLLNAIEDFEQRRWLERVDGVWRCRVDLQQLDAVPESTYAMIDARLVALPPASLELLEAASVIGANFASQTLAALVDRAVTDVELVCTAMARAGQFLNELEPVHWPDGSSSAQYGFRHALYQQVLHGRVTAARRQSLHRAVAQHLEHAFGDATAESSGGLALHYELGGDLARAVTYHARGAELARARFSLEQAVTGYRHALALLRRLPPDAARDAREMSLQSELITSLYATDGPGAAELESIAARIDALSRSGAATPALLTSLFGLIAFCITRADLGRAEDTCRRALQRAAEMEEGAFFVDVARGLSGFVQHRRGRLAAAIPDLEAGAALPLIGASGMLEPSTACASDLGFTLVLMGELQRGLAMMRDAEARSAATGHPPTIVYASSNMLRIGQILDDRAIVSDVADTMRELGERLAAPRIIGYARMADGWLRLRDGDADGLVAFREGWKVLESYSHYTYAPFSAHQAAVALLRLGQIEAARAMLDEGFVLLERTDARWCEPELHRSRGEIAAAVAATHGARS
ncbi:MAG: AAA family ATPase, partial [Deltaproteobacteria bacterium]|nr:AAA family ATPase [Deltaproteobacteria bacterium]